MNNISIYGYSPRHVVLLRELRGRLRGGVITIVGPQLFIKLINDTDIFADVVSLQFVELKQATKEIPLFRRVINNILNLIKLKKLKTNVLITANEYALPSMLLAANNKCEEILIVDEGDFDIILSKEKKLNRYRLAFNWKTLIFGLKPRLTDPRISTIVSGSKIVKRLYPQKIINPRISLGTRRLDLGDKSILLITSPLTENSNSLYKLQELDILKKFAYENYEYKIFLRTHYREAKDKYKELEQMSNVQVLKAYRSEPIENINISCECVVGFHSTALLSRNIVSTGRFTLSRLLNSPHALSILEQLEEKGLILLDSVRLSSTE